MNSPKDKSWFVMHVFLAVSILFVSGAVYRHFTPKWMGTGLDPIKLPIPLKNFQNAIGDWQGEELPIRSITQDYMRDNFADDYMSRRYSNLKKRTWADVYVVYCSSRPAGILGHKPDVCYLAFGWILDEKNLDEIITKRGRKVSCLIQRFHKPSPNYAEIVVLSFYLVNGQIATDQKSFSGLIGRNPNISGDPAKYVSQVQINAPLENAIRIAAQDIIDDIIDILPDQDGIVRAMLQ